MQLPTIPVIHNVDVRVADSADGVRTALAKQAANAVRWVETIEAFANQGVTHIVECGPGKVLTGLVKRSVPGIEALALNDSDAIAAAVDTVTAAP